MGLSALSQVPAKFFWFQSAAASVTNAKAEQLRRDLANARRGDVFIVRNSKFTRSIRVPSGVTFIADATDPKSRLTFSEIWVDGTIWFFGIGQESALKFQTIAKRVKRYENIYEA
jgi:hypothetical protein